MRRQFLLILFCLTIALSGCAHHRKHDPWGAYGSINDPWAVQYGEFYEPGPPQYLPALYPGDPMAGRRLAKKKSRRRRNSIYDETPYQAHGMPYGYGMLPGYGLMPAAFSACGDVCDPCGCDSGMAWSPGIMPGAHGMMSGADGACCGTEFVAPSCAAPIMQAPDCAVPGHMMSMPPVEPGCAVPGIYHSAPGEYMLPNEQSLPVPQPNPDSELQEFKPPTPASQPDTAMHDGLAPLPPMVHGAVWSAPPVPPVPASAQLQQPGGRIMSRQMIAAPEGSQ